MGQRWSPAGGGAEGEKEGAGGRIVGRSGRNRASWERDRGIEGNEGWWRWAVVEIDAGTIFPNHRRPVGADFC